MVFIFCIYFQPLIQFIRFDEFIKYFYVCSCLLWVLWTFWFLLTLAVLLLLDRGYISGGLRGSPSRESIKDVDSLWTHSLCRTNLSRKMNSTHSSDISRTRSLLARVPYRPTRRPDGNPHSVFRPPDVDESPPAAPPAAPPA